MPSRFLTNQKKLRLVFERDGAFLMSKVVHSSGKELLSISTRNRSLREFLRYPSSVHAARNLGIVVSNKCLQCGIMALRHYPNQPKLSEKEKAFLNAVNESGVELKEVDVIKQKEYPGIDYSDLENEPKTEDTR